MFDDKFFEQWLDSQAQKVMNLIAEGKAIAPEEMIILTLKAQTNHFAHLDQDLRADMQNMDKRLMEEMIALRKDMDLRFEQVDKRFEALTMRIDRFMIWSFSITFAVGGMVVAAIKFLPG